MVTIRVFSHIFLLPSCLVTQNVFDDFRCELSPSISKLTVTAARNTIRPLIKENFNDFQGRKFDNTKL